MRCAVTQINVAVAVLVAFNQICTDIQNQSDQRCKGVFDICLLKGGCSHYSAPFTLRCGIVQRTEKPWHVVYHTIYIAN